MTNPDTKYHYGVPGRTLTCHELATLLERFPLERTAARTLQETTEAQVQLLLARIAALTDVLRDAALDETARVASRMLLEDLTAVAAHFRGRTNGMRPSLAKALAELRDLRHESADSEGR